MALSFIKSSGGIISDDFCVQLAQETGAAYVKDKSFNIKKVDEHIAVSFELLRERWEEIRLNLLNKDMDNTQVRKRWLLPFFRLLDFEPVYQKSHIKSDAGVMYDISHIGWSGDDTPPIHMIPPSQDLDSKDRNNRTHSNKSPHDMLQNFLNTSHHTWAISTNGLKIRILRDFHHSITKSFLEFDLEGIFETADTEQYRVLFRLLHKSRFINQKRTDRQDTEEAQCLLEKFHQLSVDTGVQIGNKLRDQVKRTIEKFGNGYVEHMNWREISDDEVKEIYSEILNVIYRILFLLFAEQKGWLPIKNEVYAQTYSINSLRYLAEKGDYLNDRNSDLWQGLLITFNLVSGGYTFPNGDTINAFGGQLFSDTKISRVKDLPLKNSYLLEAINELTYFEHKRIRHKINYTTLDINALGSVYESLLDYEPKIVRVTIERNGTHIPAGSFILDDSSTERKTTGSYYTDPRLVGLLVDSALRPVMSNAIEYAITQDEKEQELLDLKICDMACGSGAFLIAALEALGNELALIRKGDEELPTDEQLREAKREVLLHCIYGVDLNPMAVELAKFSLWITASMPNLPLIFLDHKIKCGNSLIGAEPALLAKGIPVEAYERETLDDPEVCSSMRRVIRSEHEQIMEGTMQFTIPLGVTVINDEHEGEQYLEILRSGQYTPEEVRQIEEKYNSLYIRFKKERDWKLADAWTSAFFIKKDSQENVYPTNEILYYIETGNSIDTQLEGEIKSLSNEYKYFHWHLEFPEVFNKGGFDCILGNPPWEKVKIQDREFFKHSRPDIANATADQRSNLLNQLENQDLELNKKYLNSKSYLERISKFLISSNKYPLMGRGDVNTYMVFTELGRNNISLSGRLGLIVPTGVAIQDTTKEFFSDLIEKKNLVSLYDFENLEALFHGVHRNTRFCLLTISGALNDKPIDLLFGATNPEHLLNEDRHFSLTPEELKSINPNTKNCPVFRYKRDTEIVKKIYRNHNILVDENDELNGNPWKVKYVTMFHMSNDSGFFKSKSDLIKMGFELEGNIFYRDNEKYLPLFEGKMIEQYNHRFSSIEYMDEVVQGRHDNIETTEGKLRDQNYVVQPRFWVNRKDMPILSRVPEKLITYYGKDNEDGCKEILELWEIYYNNIYEAEGEGEGNINNNTNNDFAGYILDDGDIEILNNNDDYLTKARILINRKLYKWLLGFRDVTYADSERTAIFSAVPRVPAGNSMPILKSPKNNLYLLLANFNSIIFDYVARQKIGSNHLNYYILKQLPVISENQYPDNIINIIKKNVISLVYNSNDMRSFAQDLDCNESPNIWNSKDRVIKKCELDAIYAQLYLISDSDLQYIFESYKRLKNKEIEFYGTYKSKELTLNYFNDNIYIEGYPPGNYL